MADLRMRKNKDGTVDFFMVVAREESPAFSLVFGEPNLKAKEGEIVIFDGITPRIISAKGCHPVNLGMLLTTYQEVRAKIVILERQRDALYSELKTILEELKAIIERIGGLLNRSWLVYEKPTFLLRKAGF